MATELQDCLCLYQWHLNAPLVRASLVRVSRTRTRTRVNVSTVPQTGHCVRLTLTSWLNVSLSCVVEIKKENNQHHYHCIVVYYKICVSQLLRNCTFSRCVWIYYLHLNNNNSQILLQLVYVGHSWCKFSQCNLRYVFKPRMDSILKHWG